MPQRFERRFWRFRPARGFLFSAKRAMTPVGFLSGGECNRVILAKLFTRPTNLMILDEPTNDLDMESLELLEATLLGYSCTLLLVSHDRAFLDNVVTQTLVAEGEGRWREYVGGYSDWLAQRAGRSAPSPAVTRPAEAPARERNRQRLSYREQHELDGLPSAIETLEQEKAALTAAMCAPDYHRTAPEQMRGDGERLNSIDLEIEAAPELSLPPGVATRAAPGWRRSGV